MKAAVTPDVFAVFVGIDVSADSVDLAIRDSGSIVSTATRFAQTPAAYQQLIAHIQATGAAPSSIRVVLEATGVYGIALATALAAAKFAVCVVNPLQAHRFGQATLKRRKTDAVDAQLLAELGARLALRPWSPPPPIHAEVQQRLALRDALVQMRVQVTNHHRGLLRLPRAIPAVLDRLEAQSLWLSDEIRAVERELVTFTKTDEPWAQATRRLLTIPGIGNLTAWRIVVLTRCFDGFSTPGQAAAYAGLVPYLRESGTTIYGYQSGQQSGNRALRLALYQAAGTALRCNPAIKPFYKRLRAAGKPAVVARIAAARKLLHIAWAVVAKEQDFDPEYGNAKAAE